MLRVKLLLAACIGLPLPGCAGMSIALSSEGPAEATRKPLPPDTTAKQQPPKKKSKTVRYYNRTPGKQ
jgi:hypothetical protein